MRLRSIAVVAMLALAAGIPACRRAAPVRPPEAGAGRLVAQRREGERLFDLRAKAFYCAGDSLLVVLAIGDRWSGGLTVRGRFPLDSARTFTVHPAVAGEGTASVALRSVVDSVHTALLGSRGTVRLEPGPAATGRFEFVAPPVPGTGALQYVAGAFRAVPVADSASACGQLPRTQ